MKTDDLLEEWKQIPDADGYFVSNLGRVKTKRTITKGYKTKSYLRVGIKYNSGKVFDKKVHRLVAEAFIPNPNNLATVNHKDFNCHNNNVDNLEWMSAKDNILHGKKFGRCIPKGIGIEKILTIYTFHLSKYPGRHPLCIKAFNISSTTYEKHVRGTIKAELHYSIFGGTK